MPQRLCDPSDMLRVVPERSLSKVTTTKREQFCQDASDEVLGYLQNVCTPPLVSWGSDVRSKTAAIATYECLASEGFDSADQGSSLLRRAEAARAYFKGLTAKPASVVDSTTDVEEGGPVIVTSKRRDPFL